MDIATIEKAKTIAIYRHVNPDPDAYGSQFGLATAIHELFPDKQIYCGGERVERLNYLYDDCDAFFVPLTNPELIIIVDTANAERIDTEESIDFTKVMKIDHHPSHDAYGKANYVNDQVPATAAILLTQFIRIEKEYDISFSHHVWDKIYLGIVGDTGNFSYGIGLNQAFFTEVGYLFEQINQKQLLAQLFAKSLSEIQFKGLLMTKIQEEQQFAYIDFDSNVVHEHGVTLDFATGLVNIMSELQGVEVWATFCEDFDTGIIRCSLRSRTVDISQIARQFGGGGHINASGIRVESWEIVQQIKNVIKELLK